MDTPGRNGAAVNATGADVDVRRTFEYLIARFLDHHRRLHHSDATIRALDDTLRRFVAYFRQQGWRCDVDDQARQILDHARAWLDDVTRSKSARGQAYSVESIHRYTRDVRAFFSWLSTEDYTPYHYLTRLERPKRGKKHPKALTTAQLNQIMCLPEFQPTHQYGARNLCILLVYVDTWARLNEIVDLPLAKVFMPEAGMLVNGKGNIERIVRFGPDTQRHLARYIDQWRPRPQTGQDHLFLTASGHNLSPSAIQSLFRRVALKTGIPISPHKLRHTGGTAGARANMTLDDIRKKLGHSSDKTSKGYIDYAEQLTFAQNQPSGVDYLQLSVPRPGRKARRT